MARQPVTVPPSLLIFKDLRLRGFALSMNSTRESKAALLNQVVPLAEKGLFCSSRLVLCLAKAPAIALGISRAKFPLSEMHISSAISSHSAMLHLNVASLRSYREFHLQDFQDAIAFCQESYRDAKAIFTMR
jgi:hypothetical protein